MDFRQLVYVTELYLVVLYQKKVSSSNEIIAVKLLSAVDAQMK